MVGIQWNLRIKDTLGTIYTAVVSFVKRLSSLRRFKMYLKYRETNFGTMACVLCREVYYTVSLSRRVHYRRFHCIVLILINIQLHGPGLASK